MRTRQERTDQEQDIARKRLEADLLQSGWIETYPKWLGRDDRLFEKKHRRILVDEIGAFTYKRQEAGWRIHRGIVGYDRARILDLFEKAGH